MDEVDGIESELDGLDELRGWNQEEAWEYRLEDEEGGCGSLGGFFLEAFL